MSDTLPQKRKRPSAGLARAIAQGLHSQGWSVVGIGGTWAGALSFAEKYIERREKAAVAAYKATLIRELENRHMQHINQHNWYACLARELREGEL